MESALEDCIDDDMEEEDILETLREMKLFKRFTDKSLLNLVHMKAEEDVSEFRIKITLNTRGKIGLDISMIEE